MGGTASTHRTHAGYGFAGFLFSLAAKLTLRDESGTAVQTLKALLHQALDGNRAVL